MLDSNGNVTGLHKANKPKLIFKWRLQVSSWHPPPPPLLLVQPLECCPWCSALENERHVLLPIISSVQRDGHVQQRLDLLLPTTWMRNCSFTLQNLWLTRTHCELCLVQEAVAHCFVYLWCFVCFASVEHYSEQCADFNFFFFSLRASAAWHLKALQALMI